MACISRVFVMILFRSVCLLKTYSSWRPGSTTIPDLLAQFPKCALDCFTKDLLGLLAAVEEVLNCCEKKKKKNEFHNMSLALMFFLFQSVELRFTAVISFLTNLCDFVHAQSYEVECHCAKKGIRDSPPCLYSSVVLFRTQKCQIKAIAILFFNGCWVFGQ